ncbi:sodium-dependent transporter [Oceanobacillus bengalensis]|uniref:Sodium-dependent transporter n=1 Tax=Oceanobacillus bengalensis TaxID=1435466 RepID=A0A494YRG2_9BACI|nr:sodium-dependent transporter [Oceanobacillus bengalensis]RKQ11968.1 sodium-dependent transporter [Oceanobacillus bengalensis]
METRSQWGTRAGFILAAAGSAIGLGNIWRFPSVAYENGGGAFFIPYLFALLTAGIPLLIMEFTIGQKYRGSAPMAFSKMNKKAEWIGWWGALVAFVISTYYSVIIAWAISYSTFSFNLGWGEDTEGFLFNDYLQLAAPGEFGGFVPSVLIPLIIVWAVVLAILFAGVKKGIEIANRIFIPLLVVLFLFIVIYALTLPGALDGLNAFFQPDFGAIMSADVWVAAYGQIFFSLSIAFAIMIAYASYLPKKSDITNNAFIVGFGNSSFELLAGIGVFATLGFMAGQAGVGVEDVVAGGVGLAFVVFPQIINELPMLNGLVGFLFFASLVLAGFSSLISITEAYISAIIDKFKISRAKAVFFGGGLSAVISLIYATRGGLNFLDTVDYFINQFGVAFIGLVEVVVVAWFLREVKNLKEHANGISDIQLGAWWGFSLSVITPIVLGVMMVQLFVQNLLRQFDTDTGNYGNYADDFIIYSGWAVAASALIIGIIMSFTKWRKETNSAEELQETKEAK